VGPNKFPIKKKFIRPRKGQVIGMFPPQKPPLAVLLNAVSGRDKAIAT
jgi:hypothetical protein